VSINANDTHIEKSEAAEAHNAKIAELEKRSEHLMYSDGSLLEDKEARKRNVGYAAVRYRLGKEITTRIGPMGSKSEVYDAEMAGLAWTASDALQYADAHPDVVHIHFFADNTAALAAIFESKPAAGQVQGICGCKVCWYNRAAIKVPGVGNQMPWLGVRG
jgi:hypothetical protein